MVHSLQPFDCIIIQKQWTEVVAIRRTSEPQQWHSRSGLGESAVIPVQTVNSNYLFPPSVYISFHFRILRLSRKQTRRYALTLLTIIILTQTKSSSIPGEDLRFHQSFHNHFTVIPSSFFLVFSASKIKEHKTNNALQEQMWVFLWNKDATKQFVTVTSLQLIHVENDMISKVDSLV